MINLDGTTGSSRLFKILPTGSLVLKQESRWQQWCACWSLHEAQMAAKPTTHRSRLLIMQLL